MQKQVGRQQRQLERASFSRSTHLLLPDSSVKAQRHKVPGESSRKEVTSPFALIVVCRKIGLYWLFPPPGATTLITPSSVVVFNRHFESSMQNVEANGSNPRRTQDASQIHLAPSRREKRHEQHG